MGLQVVPGYIGQSGYAHPVETFRNLLKGQTAGGKGYLKAATDFNLTPSGAGLSLGVDAGWAAIPGVESTSQGSYFVWSNGGDSIAWPSASGQPRIDSLILRVIDKQYGTDPDANGAQWEVCQGVPAASPSAIADIEFDAGGSFHRYGAWWRVCNVLISPGNTVMTSTVITDLKQYADFQRTNNNTLKSWYDGTLTSAWSTYTPVLSADSGTPTIGNGSVTGRYKQLGKMVHVRGIMTVGSTTAAAGGWYLSLPVTAHATGNAIGSAYLRDVSAAGAGHFIGISAVLGATSTSRIAFYTQANNQVTSANPFAWASGDTINFSLTYEAA